MGHPSIRRSGFISALAAAAIALGACTSAGAPAAATAPAPTTAPTAAPTSAPTAPPAAPTTAPTTAATAVPASAPAAATATPPASAAATAAAGGGSSSNDYGYGDGYGSPASAKPSTPSGSTGGGGTALAARDISGVGTVLVGPTGMTLYTYAQDTAGKSACSGGCASAWPPLDAESVPSLPAGFTGKVSLISRDDGSKQVAYDGHPLYGFSGDSAPGEANGQGSGGAWFVVVK